MINALRDGMRRVDGAPAILFGLYLLTVGLSEALETAGRGVDPSGPVDVAGASEFLMWLFLGGGILDRYARDRPTRSYGFFGASGLFFFRFLRLALVLGIGYALVIRARQWFPSEGSAFWIAGAPLVVLQLIGEYAAVCSVVEDRRSMISAISAAVRFIVANAGAVILIFAGTYLMSLAVNSILPLYLRQPGVGAWSLFIATQLASLAHLWVRLVGLASGVSLFQSKLAHAGYVARTQPAWPESPAAEAITAAGRSRR